MYATNDNLQAIESRNRITEAMLSLMKRDDYKNITITQICQEAQIVRQTYYRNFDSKDDIIKLYLDHMIQQYLADYYKTTSVHTQLRDFFAFMLQSREFLHSVADNSLFYMIDETISINIEKFINFQQITAIEEPKLEKYVTGFVSSTICSLLSLWVDNEFAESPEMLSQLAQRFLGGLGGVISC
ncbi:MAG: TetR/AcrR family transcriptional regulator [Clostridiaceae bacterium]|nr:TetR/AcrR family transcriptional regulator [Clostridiaceae bacterium]